MRYYGYQDEALCPFYVSESRFTITCEGLLPEAAVQHRFATEDEARQFERTACLTMDYGKHCPHAAALLCMYAAAEAEEEIEKKLPQREKTVV